MAKKIKLAELTPHPDNPRKITKKKLEELKQSIRQFEKMMELRPIVFTEAGMIIGGNMRYRALIELGYEEIPASWTKRAEGLTEEEQREFIIKDNIGFGDWDNEALLGESWRGFDLEGWGMPVLTSDVSEGYSTKIKAPVYEVTGEEPGVTELVDTGKYEELMREIEAAEVEEEIKVFLRLAAARHILFSYEKIAEFYAHQKTEVQELMEKSALVIIDFDKAIENGYAILSKEIIEQYQSDYSGDGE